ncbi:acylneuraminate cytidylyltransferase, partial [sediment metagenome]
PVAREHVTAYFKRNPQFAPITTIPVDPEYQLKGVKISVDTPADLELIENLHRELNAQPGDIEMRDLCRLLREKPQLLKANAHILRKGISTKSIKILFRCDGDSELGMGHIVRCGALAQELRDSHGCGAVFGVRQGTPGEQAIRELGFPILAKDNSAEDDWLPRTVKETGPDAVVLDIRTPVSNNALNLCKAQGALLAVIDDIGDRRLSADMVFYPPVPQVKQLDWTGFKGEVLSGWEWVILRKEFFLLHKSRIPHQPQQLLVTMGGADPAGFVFRVIKAIEPLEKQFEVTVVTGKAFQKRAELEQAILGSKHHYALLNNVSNMVEIMENTDLAIASFGMTAYELATIGIPAVYLCLTDDHALSAATFTEAGIGISAGTAATFDEQKLCKDISNALSQLTAMEQKLTQMQNLLDGKGAGRIAEHIMKRIEKRQ